jgi:hypothetical protein
MPAGAARSQRQCAAAEPAVVLWSACGNQMNAHGGQVFSLL